MRPWKEVDREMDLVMAVLKAKPKVLRRPPGRPSKFTAAQIARAHKMKDDGEPNNEIAKILHLTKTPTASQRRNVSNILKNHPRR